MIDVIKLLLEFLFYKISWFPAHFFWWHYDVSTHFGKTECVDNFYQIYHGTLILPRMEEIEQENLFQEPFTIKFHSFAYLLNLKTTHAALSR